MQSSALVVPTVGRQNTCYSPAPSGSRSDHTLVARKLYSSPWDRQRTATLSGRLEFLSDEREEED